MKDLQAYRGRRVLVTGHTGFKGAWLSLWLRELGATVTGYALDPSKDDLGWHVGIADIVSHYSGDIRDSRSLLRLFERTQPEVVFHLAAQPLVRLSYEQPVATFETNVGGSLHLLDAVRSTPSVKSLVYVTSDKCYRNREWSWGYRENDELGGDDPYSASKAAAEILFGSYQASFFRHRGGFGAASARAGNVIGGGDWSRDRIVPDCIRSLRAGHPIQLRRPSATRPWQHVLEPVFGYLLLGAKLLADPERYSGSWNFGPSAESVKTVGELARAVVVEWGVGSVEEAPEPNAAHETSLLSLSCEKAIRQLGWQARWNFQRAVRETVAWYREFTCGASASDLCRHQIADFIQEETGNDSRCSSSPVEANCR